MKKIPSNIAISIEQLIEIVNKVMGNRAKKIILYGSYARGDFKKDSDIDIMILTDFKDDEIDEYRDKIWDLAYDIELQNNVMLMPLIKNIDKFNYWQETLPFYINIQKEGVVLSEC